MEDNLEREIIGKEIGGDQAQSAVQIADSLKLFNYRAHEEGTQAEETNDGLPSRSNKGKAIYPLSLTIFPGQSVDIQEQA